jgi:hypothetical protein
MSGPLYCFFGCTSMQVPCKLPWDFKSSVLPQNAGIQKLKQFSTCMYLIAVCKFDAIRLQSKRKRNEENDNG